jgi:phage protein D
MAQTASIPIYQGQDFWVPAFEVKIQGRPQGQGVIRDVQAVTYKDNLEQMDSFEITINNWDADTRKFKYSDQNIFDPGKQLELWMGYFGKDNMRLMLKGEINTLRPAFPSGGVPTLTIGGLNILDKFRKEQQSQVYENMTDAEIAEKIGRERLNIDVVADKPDPEPRYPYVIQDNQLDILFLMERARRIGFDIFVEEKASGGQSQDSVLRFASSTELRRSVYQLTYRKSLIEFSPELTTAKQVGKVTVNGWNAKTKEKITYTATRAELNVRGAGDSASQGKIDKTVEEKGEIVATKPVSNKDEARALALRLLETNAKDLIKANASVPGLPDLRAGSVVIVDGVGDRFAGRYFVTGTTHTIADSGYTTQFECRREEI